MRSKRGWLSYCLVFLLASSSIVLTQCRTFRDGSQLAESTFDSIDDGFDQCVALRGNGPWVGTHFASLARIVGDYGEVHALAGGSSSTVTSFLYESMLKHPLVASCQGDRLCNLDISSDMAQTIRERRLELLLKSVYGFMAQEKGNIAAAIGFTMTWLGDVQRLERTFSTLTDTDYEAFKSKIVTWERKYALSGLVNPQLLSFLAQERVPLEYRKQEAVAAVEALQGFRVEDKRKFFRPGLINFTMFKQVIARFADFYAKRFFSPELAGEFDEWLQSCAMDTAGQSWASLLRSKNKRTSSCAQRFPSILNRYLLAYEDQRKLLPDQPSRLYDRVGTELPVLISTSVYLPNDPSFVSMWQDRYLKGGDITGFNPGFENIFFGYWGPGVAFNEELKANLKDRFPEDPKTQKFMNLGAADWDIVLGLSPAEPGLAPMLPVQTITGGKKSDTDLYSLGGWSDLAPVQVLKAMNCKRSIYVTREGGEADIALDATLQLNASEQERSNLYYSQGAGRDRFTGLPNTASGLSSFQLALREAVQERGVDVGGVWCTNWNKFGLEDILAMSEEAYNARFITGDVYYTQTEAKNIKEPSLVGSVSGCTAEMPRKSAAAN